MPVYAYTPGKTARGRAANCHGIAGNGLIAYGLHITTITLRGMTMAFNLLRGLATLCGLLMVVMGLNFILDPAAAVAQLGMPLLPGDQGRSTQLGDLTAFFLSMGAMILLGTWTGNRTWLYAAVMLMGGTALFRTLAYALHGADFATQEIVVEVISSIILLLMASKLPAKPA